MTYVKIAYTEDVNMYEMLRQSELFSGMDEDEIKGCLNCGKAKITSYKRGEMIFLQTDTPDRLTVLLEGSVVVGSDSSDGRRSIVAAFDKPGELFGEVFVFLNGKTYGQYAQASADSKVLNIPKSFLYHTCGQNCRRHEKLISNMLSLLAHKAYSLNRHLQVLSCATLRQKIAMALLNSVPRGELTAKGINREKLADYLNAARPSVSRELMRMQKDGLIKICGKNITIEKEKLRGIF